jgi:hypothetical protein
LTDTSGERYDNLTLSRAFVTFLCHVLLPRAFITLLQEFFKPDRLSPGVHNATNPRFAGWKTEVPVAYEGGLFRLELNSQLYEGLR